MKKTTLLILLILFYNIATISAQQWTVYNTVNSDIVSNKITSVKIDEMGNKWISSNSGIAKFDNTTWTVYSTFASFYSDGIAIDTSDSLWFSPEYSGNTVCKLNDSCYDYFTSTNPFPVIYLATILAIDTNNNIWLAGGGGSSGYGTVLKFDGNNWTESISDIDNVHSIKIDAAQNVWIGGRSIIGEFDGTTWNHYPIEIINNNYSYVFSIAIDSNDTKWLATSTGLKKFDGTLTTYTTINSGIQSNYVSAITIDAVGNIWLGTDYGLAKFDGVNWTIYTESNSGLPDNNIKALATDIDGRIWIGTEYEGLVVFDPLSVGIEENFIDKIKLTVTPNPFSTSTTIKITNQNQVLKNYNVKMYDVFGRMVKQMKVSTPSFNIEREALPKGLYIIHILSDKKVIGTEKLVISDH